MDGSQLRKIIWLDSNGQAGWHDPTAQKYGPLTVTSVGWLIHEGEDSVTLAGSVIFGAEYQATGTMTIPKVCIVNDKVLAER